MPQKTKFASIDEVSSLSLAEESLGDEDVQLTSTRGAQTRYSQSQGSTNPRLRTCAYIESELARVHDWTDCSEDVPRPRVLKAGQPRVTVALGQKLAAQSLPKHTRRNTAKRVGLMAASAAIMLACGLLIGWSVKPASPSAATLRPTPPQPHASPTAPPSATWQRLPSPTMPGTVYQAVIFVLRVGTRRLNERPYQTSAELPDRDHRIHLPSLDVAAVPSPLVASPPIASALGTQPPLGAWPLPLLSIQTWPTKSPTLSVSQPVRLLAGRSASQLPAVPLAAQPQPAQRHNIEKEGRRLTTTVAQVPVAIGERGGRRVATASVLIDHLIFTPTLTPTPSPSHPHPNLPTHPHLHPHPHPHPHSHPHPHHHPNPHPRPHPSLLRWTRRTYCAASPSSSLWRSRT